MNSSFFLLLKYKEEDDKVKTLKKKKKVKTLKQVNQTHSHVGLFGFVIKYLWDFLLCLE